MSQSNDQQKNAHLNFITEVKFEGDKPIPFKCWTEENYINVKLDIEVNGVKGGTLRCKMNLDYANIFIQQAIPAILEKESTLIKEYLKNV